MNKKKKQTAFKSFKLLSINMRRVFIVFIAAVILLTGLASHAVGQTGVASTPDPQTDASTTINEMAKISPEENQSKLDAQTGKAVVIPSGVAKKWIERYNEISEGIHKGILDHKKADLFYQELNEALLEKRNRLRDALKALADPSQHGDISKTKAQSKTSEIIKPPQDSQKEHSSIVYKLNMAEQLYLELRALYDIRIRLLEQVSDELRNRVIGTRISGVQAFKEELDYLFLVFRYRANLMTQSVNLIAGRMIGAPLPVFFAIIKILLVVLVFFWWRGWAVKGIPELRSNIINIKPGKRVHKHLAKWLWYLNRVRSPLEWLLFLTVVFNIIRTEELLFLNLLCTQIQYILFAGLIVALVNAISARGAVGLKSRTARIRLKSVWIVILWILLASFGRNFIDDLVGKGTIYVWVWNFLKSLTLPMLFLIVHWWRPEIYRRIENLHKPSSFTEKILGHRQGFIGFLGAASGAVFLINDTFRQKLLRIVAKFEWGHYFISNMTRIEALRASEHIRKEDQGAPISEEMRRRFYESEGSIVESVGQDILGKMTELVKQEQQGALVIVSERGGGKTQLLERLDMRFEKKMLLFDCPPGGNNAFKSALAGALELKTTDLSSTNILERIQERQISVIGIDNIHRLCRPALGGQEELNQMTKLIKPFETNLLWFYGVDWTAWQYISRVRANSLFLDDVVMLPLWKENQIMEMIEKRCAHAGITPDFGELILPRQFEDMDYETAEERNRYGFYRILWNTSDGNPKVALQLWIDCLKISTDGRIIVSLPRLPSTHELENVDSNILFLLRIIAQSGYASPDEIADGLGFSETEVINALRFAQARNWVELEDGRYCLTWKWFRSITRTLARQNLLLRRNIGGAS